MVDSSFRLMQKYLRTSRTEWKSFAIYGVTYALLSLLVPLIVQLLVNNLARHSPQLREAGLGELRLIAPGHS